MVNSLFGACEDRDGLLFYVLSYQDHIKHAINALSWADITWLYLLCFVALSLGAFQNKHATLRQANSDLGVRGKKGLFSELTSLAVRGEARQKASHPCVQNPGCHLDVCVPPPSHTLKPLSPV